MKYILYVMVFFLASTILIENNYTFFRDNQDPNYLQTLEKQQIDLGFKIEDQQSKSDFLAGWDTGGSWVSANSSNGRRYYVKIGGVYYVMPLYKGVEIYRSSDTCSDGSLTWTAKVRNLNLQNDNNTLVYTKPCGYASW